MKHYEITFIVDPVLSGDEIKKTAKAYTSLLENEKCGITFHNEMGLQQLAYPIKKRQSGIYFCTEFTTETGEVIPKIELAMRRDERVIRFLTVKLDKYGVKYNEDKRNGLIGTIKKKVKEEDKKDERRPKRSSSSSKTSSKDSSKNDKATTETAAKTTEAKAETAAPATATKETESSKVVETVVTAATTAKVVETTTAKVVEITAAKVEETTAPTTETPATEAATTPVEVEAIAKKTEETITTTAEAESTTVEAETTTTTDEVKVEKVEKTEVAEVKVTESKEKKTSTKTSTDDLTKIEGIGPKIAELLNNAGIGSFSDLASTEVESINAILAEAGSRYSMHNPLTWPKQSTLASEGKWDELKKWQDELDGGLPAS